MRDIWDAVVDTTLGVALLAWWTLSGLAVIVGGWLLWDWLL